MKKLLIIKSKKKISLIIKVKKKKLLIIKFKMVKTNNKIYKKNKWKIT